MDADKLTQLVETACWHEATLRQHTLESPVFAETLEQLHNTLEELRVTSYELCQHHEQVEAQLRRYIQLFEEAPDGYLVADGNGMIREANQATATLLNTQQSFLLDKPLSDFIADEQRPAFLTQLGRLHQEEPLQEWAVLLQPIDAEPFDAALAVKIVQGQGNTELRVGVRDVTEYKRVLEKERLVTASAQRIRQSLNLEEVLNTTVAEVRQFLQTDRVIIYRFQADWTGDVVVESVASGWSSLLGISVTHPLEENYVQFYRQGKITAISNIHTAGLDYYHIHLLAEFGVVGNLVVPILQEEQLWGLLIVHHCSGPRQWQQLEIELLKSFAAQVGIAIHQSQLYEQAQCQAKRERVLNQVTQAIRSSLDLNTVFETAVREIVELLQVDRAKIVQYLPERKCWLHVSEYCKSQESPTSLGQEIPDENNPIAERLKRLEIVRIDDTNTLEDDINKGLAKAFPGAWLLVPLYFGSCVLGSLTLGKDTYSYRWQESEIQLIRVVADQVVIAIHQAQLYNQLTKSEEKFRQLAETIRDVFWMLDAKTLESSYISPVYEQIWGRTCESWYANPRSFAEAVHPDDQELLTKTLEKYQQGEEIDIEYRILKSSGEMHWIHDRAFFVRNESGEIYRQVGIARDITRRKQVEQERDRFFNLSLDMLTINNFEGYFTFVNPAWQRILGWTLEELQTQPIYTWIHPADWQASRAAMKKLRAGFSVSGFENRYRCKDGSYKWLSWTAAPFPEERLIYTIARDVTERKQAEAQIQASLQEKEVLLKEIHHRVKNNMQVISSLLDLQSQQVQDPTVREMFRESQNRIRSMVLIHEKLYLSKNLARIDFASYIQDLTAQLLQTYAYRSNEIVLNLNIEQVFLKISTAIPCGLIINELVSNTLRHAFADNTLGKLWIKFSTENNQFSLIIKDNGTRLKGAIDLQTTKSLGLQLVQTLVRQLNGQIETEQNQGLTFKISFPELDS